MNIGRHRQNVNTRDSQMSQNSCAIVGLENLPGRSGSRELNWSEHDSRSNSTILQKLMIMSDNILDRVNNASSRTVGQMSGFANGGIMLCVSGL
jgi:hypothetical protein